MSADSIRKPNSASKQSRAPAWFAGKELDVLNAGERVRLYGDVVNSTAPKRPILLIVIGALNVPNVMHGFQTGMHRSLWVAVTVVFFLAVLSAWGYRRLSILRDGRRAVRERADWPLRNQRASSTP